MSRERERGHRLAESVLGPPEARGPSPAFPRVAEASRARDRDGGAGLERELERLRRLPKERAEAELAFMKERGWLLA